MLRAFARGRYNDRATGPHAAGLRARPTFAKETIMNKTTKHNRQDSNRAILNGLDTHLKGQNIVLEGVSYKQPQLRQIFQDDLDATAATNDTKAQWQSAVLAEKTTATKTHGVKRALFSYLAATFGVNSQVLIDFGSAPKKAGKIKPAIKAVAVTQALATRKARHIMGRKQRLEIPPAVTASAPAATTTSVVTTTAQPQATPVVAPTAPAAVANGTNGVAATNGAGAAARA
jgi:hypothetical protein